jgi:hypothetical protein
VVELWDLWMRWFDGQQVSGATLWGQPIFYWARWGKGLQFLAGLTVILDLVGPDALRAFGKRLTKVPWSKGFSTGADWAASVVMLLSFVAYVGFFVVSYLADHFVTVQEMFGDLIDVVIAKLKEVGAGLILVALFLTSVLLYRLATSGEPRMRRRQRQSEAKLAVVASPAALIAIVTFTILVLPWALFIYGLCLPLSRGLAFLLDRARPAHPARWVAFFLFVVGFHFDFLAS